MWAWQQGAARRRSWLCTQRATASHVCAERGFDYIMTIKGNQPTLQKKVADRCRPLVATAPAHIVEERAHGRINRWSTWSLIRNSSHHAADLR